MESTPSSHLADKPEIFESSSSSSSLDRETFINLLNKLPLATAYIGPDYRYLYSSQAHREMWDLIEEDVIGKSVEQVIGKQNYKNSKRHLESALAGKHSLYEVEVDFPGVGYRHVRVDFIPDLDDQGGVKGCLVICDNLTDLREAELGRLRILERYQHLYNKTPVMLHSIDREGRIISVSDYWLDMMGYLRSEVLGRRSTEFLTPASAQYAREVVLPEFYRTGICKDVPYQFVRKNGEIMEALLSATAECDEHGLIQRSLAVVVDVTELKQAEAQKLELENQLRHSQKMEALGTLAGGIAHDFNNILAGIIGYTELALTKAGQESKVKNYLDHVHTSAYRAKNLVQQILTFSQRAKTERVPVRATRIVDEVLTLAKATFPASVQILSKVAEPNLHLLGDATQIHQVLLNICTNAVHAMEGVEGILEVIIEGVEVGKRYAASHGNINPGHYVRITISDNGRGMDDDIRKRIFEPYFTTKKIGEGTGLGLSVCHGIVAHHGGTISVWSKPQKGAKIAVYFPRVFATEERREVEQLVTEGGHGRILFVDDEPVLAQLGGEMLTTLGYEVIAISSSTEALQLFESAPNEYDLVITDLTMPLLSGGQFAEEIRRIRSDLPVIVCTGYGAHADQDKLSRMGNVDILSKPFSLKELGESVRKVLK